MIKQNTFHAVMSQRNPNMDTFDNFPTPPWATRAFVESQLLGANDLATSTCLEPACGQGYMSETLKEYFGAVSSFDILDYGYKDMEKRAEKMKSGEGYL
jgi:ubiquinone/menaquinone biosynthesis C-methylase UbiE